MRPRSMLLCGALACVLVPAYAFVAPRSKTVRPVEGSGVHYFSSAIVHSEELSPDGKIVRSTETVDLTGGLEGRILYQPTSVFDFSKGTLVNTGRQVFSGTVLGSSPVVLYDDEFRFEVALASGTMTGTVYLTGQIAGPETRCELTVAGAGSTPEGNARFTYQGTCTIGGK